MKGICCFIFKNIIQGEMRISRKTLFLIMNYIYIAGILLSVTGTRVGVIAGKLKFVFIAFCLFDVLSLGLKKIRINLKEILLFSILLIYALLWSTLFVNQIVVSETKKHFIMTIYYLMILFCSCFEVENYACIYEYVLSSYYACVSILLVQCIAHLNELIKNPLYIFQAVLSNMRVRSTFGFTHTNYAGNICFVTLTLSWLLLQKYSMNDIFRSKKCIRWILTDTIIFLMLISTSSRSAIISLIIFVGSTLFFKNVKKFKLSNALKCIIVILTLVFFILLNRKFGILDYIWKNSNRQSNINTNVQLINELGNIWTGMGFTENGAFQSSWSLDKGMVSAFGVSTTTSLDMYYIYVFCTTGILGSCVMGGVLVWLFISLFRKRKKEYECLCLYISVLFYAIWESVIFTYRFWPMLIIMVIIINKAFDNGGLKNDYMY